MGLVYLRIHLPYTSTIHGSVNIAVPWMVGVMLARPSKISHTLDIQDHLLRSPEVRYLDPKSMPGTPFWSGIWMSRFAMKHPPRIHRMRIYRICRPLGGTNLATRNPRTIWPTMAPFYKCRLKEKNSHLRFVSLCECVCVCVSFLELSTKYWSQTCKSNINLTKVSR